MSRSRKAPIHTDQNSGKPQHGFAKRRAARRVRADEDIADGSAYRKVFNPWDICDWKIYDGNNPKARRK
jgi:hypothetical protein